MKGEVALPLKNEVALRDAVARRQLLNRSFLVLFSSILSLTHTLERLEDFVWVEPSRLYEARKASRALCVIHLRHYNVKGRTQAEASHEPVGDHGEGQAPAWQGTLGLTH